LCRRQHALRKRFGALQLLLLNEREAATRCLIRPEVAANDLSRFNALG
jgi:hypothetical protein